MQKLQNRRVCVHRKKLQNRRFCVILEILIIMFNTLKTEVLLLCAKTPKSEGLRPPQKLQNRRFCVVLKILKIMFNTPKSKLDDSIIVYMSSVTKSHMPCGALLNWTQTYVTSLYYGKSQPSSLPLPRA